MDIGSFFSYKILLAMLCFNDFCENMDVITGTGMRFDYESCPYRCMDSETQKVALGVYVLDTCH
ncbi:hypothetical protein [Sphaerochaeta pleomorpha]|nr:hypothetical protein [Sphaerochaeta pleomorpha]